VTRNGPADYVVFMLSTLVIIGGVFVGLLVLLAIIVGLSGRGRNSRGTTTATRGQVPPKWVVDSGQPHPDVWSPLSHTSTEIRAVR
jgi:hypothetical protein